MRYCDQCGGKVSDTAKFCEQCGGKLSEITDITPSIPEVKIDVIKEETNETEPTDSTQATTDKTEDVGEVEELDLTALDKKVTDQSPTDQQASNKPEPAEPKPIPKQNNVINLQDVLESEEKVEADDSIKREVLADDEVFSKVCPMCGEDMQLNKQLLENAPVMIKCLKCGNETKIW